jgi:hypothetical protein
MSGCKEFEEFMKNRGDKDARRSIRIHEDENDG